MATDFNEQLNDTLTHEQKMTIPSGKVANFAYDDTAYENDVVAGTSSYNYNQHQNIPLGTPTVLNTDGNILDKGVRSQASSITRMMVNHFFGRVSYNVNKLADHLKTLITTMRNFMVEGDNAYSPTASYTAGCVVYLISLEGGKSYKRTFVCKQACTDTPPLDDGEVINTTYWEEVTGNLSYAEVKRDLKVIGESTFDNDIISEKNITVKGDLIVKGSTVVTDEQTVRTKSNYVVLRESNPSGLGANEKSGMVIHNYTAGKNAFLGVDSDGMFRVSDNASETVTSYTNISEFGGSYFTGISQTIASVVSGAVVSQDVDSLENCVNEQGTYYHFFNNDWYEVSLQNNALYFDKTDPVTDATLITTLDALTKQTLSYYRSMSVLVVSDSANQPLLTRQEASAMSNDDILRWDATNKRAKGGLKVNDITSLASTYILANSRTITGGALSSGSSINVFFQSAILGSSVDTTLTLTYNTVTYPVKVAKNGALVDMGAVIDNGTYKFIQANTAMSFIFIDDGSNPYFQVIENPVVLNIDGYAICADGEAILSKQIVSQSKAILARGNTEVYIDGSNITLTLNYASKDGAVVDISAFSNCTVTYYTALGSFATLAMDAGTRVQLVYHNGWKYNGMYGAVWN